MSWSYSGNPDKNDKDKVRFIIQDTDRDEQLLSNEEIESLISSEGGALQAAMRASEILAAKFARWCDEKVGQVSVSLSQRMKHYQALRDDLKRRIAIRHSEPFAGGLTHSQKDAVEDDDDRVEPFFTRDTNDFLPQPEENIGPSVSQGIQEEDDS